MSTTGAIIGSGLGMVTGAIANKQQQRQNERNLEMQSRANKDMTIFNRQQQEELWRNTNASAQVDEYKKAGLNIGLMYEGGGAGGQTGVNAGQVNAPNAENHGGMAMQAALQTAMQAAQIENLKADSKKKETEAQEVEARTPTHAKGMEKTDAEIQEIASRLNVNEETVKKIIQDVKQSEAQTTNIEASTIRTEADTKKIIAETSRLKQMTPHEVAGKILDNSLTEAKISLTRQQEWELEQRVAGMWEKLRIDGNTQEVQKFKTEIDAMHPGLGGVIGGILETALRQIDHQVTGGKDPAYDNRRQAPTKKW